MKRKVFLLLFYFISDTDGQLLNPGRRPLLRNSWTSIF